MEGYEGQGRRRGQGGLPGEASGRDDTGNGQRRSREGEASILWEGFDPMYLVFPTRAVVGFCSAPRKMRRVKCATHSPRFTVRVTGSSWFASALAPTVPRAAVVVVQRRRIRGGRPHATARLQEREPLSVAAGLGGSARHKLCPPLLSPRSSSRLLGIPPPPPLTTTVAITTAAASFSPAPAAAAAAAADAAGTPLPPLVVPPPPLRLAPWRCPPALPPPQRRRVVDRSAVGGAWRSRRRPLPPPR